MNVLLTAAGRRSYLVRYFREALDGRGRVICANSDAEAPAMQVADQAVVVPRSNDSCYVKTIVDLCRRYEIKLLTSLHDLDLLVLSQHRDSIRATGAVPVLPDYDGARLSLDKYEMTLKLREQGFDVPWTTLDKDEATAALAKGQLQWPLIVKDRLGFGSQSLYECADSGELEYACNKIELAGQMGKGFYKPKIQPGKSALIQERLSGTEYRLGLISDLEGQLISHTRTEIHSMRAGESDRATTRNTTEDEAWAVRLGRLLHVPGFCGIDWILKNGKRFILDINPRFTGDYPFCHLAGTNLPAALINWVVGKDPEPSWVRSEPDMTGYKEIVPVAIGSGTRDE